MRTRRVQGLTLIEMLVAIAVMVVVLAAAYASVREGLKLHKELTAQAVWIMDRCALAEQVSADFRSNQGARGLGAGKWSVTRADGAEAVYEQENGRLVRALVSQPQQKKVYSVGKVDFTFPGAEPGKLLRLKFPDTELILAR